MEWAERIGKIAADAGEIIKRLRLYTTRPDHEFRSINLADAVREAASLLEWQLRAGGISLELHGHTDAIEVHADRVAIQQVVVNLVKNAGEALADQNHAEQRISVTVACETGYARVEVSDNGPGLPVQNSDELFRAFTTFKEGGTGMGLAVSRSIIERHHGQIWAHANSPHGAVFGFRIPRAVDASPSESSHLDEPPSG